MRTRIVAAVMLLSSIMMIMTACGHPTPTPAGKLTTAQLTQSVQNINQSEAANVIKNMIRMDYTKYKIDLINENLEYKGNQYFQFHISDNTVPVGPSIIVSKNNGAIFCYYPDSTVTEVYQDRTFKSKC